MNQAVSQSSKREFIGTVVSHANQTAVVRIARQKVHPKYHKRYGTRITLAAHDPENAAKVGDVVTITQDRPRSRRKRWRIVPTVHP